MATLKPGVYTVVHLTKKICAFITKHRGTILGVLETTLSAPDLEKVVIMFDAIGVGCGVLNIAYPNIPA